MVGPSFAPASAFGEFPVPAKPNVKRTHKVALTAPRRDEASTGVWRGILAGPLNLPPNGNLHEARGVVVGGLVAIGETLHLGLHLGAAIAAISAVDFNAGAESQATKNQGT